MCDDDQALRDDDGWFAIEPDGIPEPREEGWFKLPDGRIRYAQYLGTTRKGYKTSVGVLPLGTQFMYNQEPL